MTDKKKGKTATEVALEREPVNNLFIRVHGQIPYRNPARIPHMVNLLHAVWAQDRPGANMNDMRMGQLVMNAARIGGWGPNDIFNCEDEIFAQGLLRLLDLKVEDD